MTEIRDYIFGDNNRPENRLRRHREMLIGVQHNASCDPTKPSPGESIRLHVTTSGDLDFAEVYCHFTTDDGDPAGDGAQRVSLKEMKTTWDEVDWRYIHHWEGDLPAQASDTMLRYQIAARTTNSDDWVYSDNQATSAENGTRFALWVDDPAPPAWAKDALVYHVFLDRFYPGDDDTWNQTDDLSGFFGGTVRGVIQKLEYIQSLGFNTIWLSPFFPSPSHHGYNATDLYSVEPRLGSNQDLYELIEDIHARGMRIILDFVANHWSNFHPSFQAAQKDRESEYYSWYHWIAWPNEYQGFFGTKQLPKINLTLGSPARQIMLDCAQYWLEKGFDGYRLDFAYGPPLDFWVDFRRVCKKTKPDSWLFGEIIHAAPYQRSFDVAFDGLIDFLLNDAIRQTFGYNTWDLGTFDAFLAGHERYFLGNLGRLTILDNHDMNRFLFLAGDDAAKLKLAALVLYTLAGTPINYCGTEVGVTQNRPIHINNRGIFEEARMPMKWSDEQDSDLLSYFQKLLSLRIKYPWLEAGTRQTLHLDVDGGTYAYVREDSGQQVLIALNLSTQARVIKITWPGFENFRDHLFGNSVTKTTNGLTIELGEQSCAFIAK